MNITINGVKHTIPDTSTNVAVDCDGGLWTYNCEPKHTSWLWFVSEPYIGAYVGMTDPPIDFTKCLAEVSDGAVISFEGM